MTNIEFLKEYVNDMSWAIINKLKSRSGSKFTAYSQIIRSICKKDVYALDKDDQEGAYVACGLCGDIFWSVFKDQIKTCIEHDINGKDLDSMDGNLLLKMLD